MFVGEKFIRSLVDKYGRHLGCNDCGTWYPLEVREFLHLKHIKFIFRERSLLERVIQQQYFKDRTYLMIIIHALLIIKREIVIYNMYTIG